MVYYERVNPMKIIMVKDNGDMETIITDEAVIVSKTEDGDFDFHGDPSPEFLKKVIDINGLGRYRRYLISGLIKAKG